MQLASEALSEFRAIFLQEIGVELSEAEAEKEAQNLLTLFEVLTQRE